MLYHDSTVSNAILPVYTFSSPSPYSSPSSESDEQKDDLDELFGGDTILVDGNHLDIEKWSPPKNMYFQDHYLPQVPDSRMGRAGYGNGMRHPMMNASMYHNIINSSHSAPLTPHDIHFPPHRTSASSSTTTSTTSPTASTPPSAGMAPPGGALLKNSANSGNSEGGSRVAVGSGGSGMVGVGGHVMSIVLLHKPRGSKGVWYPIAQGDHIRVTKGKGKRLKLEVRTNVDISQDIGVFLVLDGGCQIMPSGNESGLIVESIRNLPPSPASGGSSFTATELSLKLSRLSRRLSILVRVKTREAVLLEARSIEFSAHNNGKESNTMHTSGPVPSSPGGGQPPALTRSRSPPKEMKFIPNEFESSPHLHLHHHHHPYPPPVKSPSDSDSNPDNMNGNLDIDISLNPDADFNTDPDFNPSADSLGVLHGPPPSPPLTLPLSLPPTSSFLPLVPIKYEQISSFYQLPATTPLSHPPPPHHPLSRPMNSHTHSHQHYQQAPLSVMPPVPLPLPTTDHIMTVPNEYHFERVVPSEVESDRKRKRLAMPMSESGENAPLTPTPLTPTPLTPLTPHTPLTPLTPHTPHTPHTPSMSPSPSKLRNSGGNGNGGKLTNSGGNGNGGKLTNSGGNQSKLTNSGDQRTPTSNNNNNNIINNISNDSATDIEKATNVGNNEATNRVEEDGDNSHTKGNPSAPNSPQSLPAKGDLQVVQGGLDVKGIVRAQGFLQYSDARLKTDIQDLADALSIVSALDGKMYRWKHDTIFSNREKPSKRVIGLIAQEVQKILPEVVHEVDGYLSVAYSEIVPVLIEALKQHLVNDAADKQEVQLQIRELDRKLQSLQNEQDQWKSYYHTMAAMRVLSTWSTPWSPPPYVAPSYAPPPYTPPSTPPPTKSSPLLTHPQPPISQTRSPPLVQTRHPQLVTYQQQFVPSSIPSYSSSQVYTPMNSTQHTKKTGTTPPTSGTYSSTSSTTTTTDDDDDAVLSFRQLDDRLHNAFRQWCSVIGFIIGSCLLITATILLIKPGSKADEGRHLEVSMVMIGFGVVCLFSVLVFYLCSKIRSGYATTVLKPVV